MREHSLVRLHSRCTEYIELEDSSSVYLVLYSHYTLPLFSRYRLLKAHKFPSAQEGEPAPRALPPYQKYGLTGYGPLTRLERILEATAGRSS